MKEALLKNDLLLFFCEKAATAYNPGGVRFTNANFSHVIMTELGLSEPLDGNIVRLILTGRSFVTPITHTLLYDINLT